MKKLTAIIVMVLMVALLSACATDDTPVQKVDTPPDGSQAVSASGDDGKENVATVGETLERGGIQFTFDRIENYVDTSNYAMDTPDDGNEFIVLWFTVRNNTDEDYHVNMFYEDSYLDGFSISAEWLFNISGDSLWGDLAAERATRGYVAYQVPIDWSEIEFQYKPIFAGQESKLIFKAYKSDLDD